MQVVGTILNHLGLSEDRIELVEDLVPGTSGVVGRLRACGVPPAGGESPALEAWILPLVNSWLKDSAPRVTERSAHRETDT